MADSKLTNKDRVDLDLVMGLIGNAFLNEKGLQQINGLMQQAKDPAGVLANIVMQSVGTVYDKLEDNGTDVSDKIWTARSGVIDQTIAEIAQAVAGTSGNRGLLDPNILEEARNQVMDMMDEQFGEDDDDEYGPPNPDVYGFREGSPDEEAAESPEEQMAEGDVGGMMPTGEIGGSHGPNRFPSGLLSGG